MVSDKVVLEARGITKRFGHLVANDNIDFQLREGEIHALLGENGAGKTTFCNILYGFLKPDKGEIYLNGRKVRFSSPKEAMDAGIGMVHQELMLIPNMTVAENIGLILNYDLRRPVLDLSDVRKKLREMAERYGLHIDPDAVMEQLSVGERQRVEILKALFKGASILIFDEPTSYLTKIETRKLFENLRRMADEGKSIIFVTHKIDEVMEISDRITVLRQGRVVAVKDRKDVSKEELARLIVGRDVLFRVQKMESRVSEPLLRLENVSALSDVGVLGLRDVSLEVRSGEILGVAGVAGNGQKELVEVITGLRKVIKGRIYLDGRDITNLPSDKIRRLGVAHIPEDLRMALVFNFTLKDNIIISPYLAEMFKKGVFVDKERLREKLREIIKEFGVVAPSEDTEVWTLSGGNKQKFILARELFWNPRVIIANNPTKGLDVAATEHIRNILMREKARGKAILMVSTDLDEILDMSDRIVVMNRGKVMGIFKPDEAEVDKIAYLMTATT